jgi:hypothetical protein
VSNGVLAQVVCRMVLAAAGLYAKVLSVNKQGRAIKMAKIKFFCYFFLVAFASTSLADDADFGALPELMGGGQIGLRIPLSCNMSRLGVPGCPLL